jgi:L-fucose isomerase-like protein
MLLDEEETETGIILNELFAIKKALKNLSGKRLGLIGGVSEWLVASDVPGDLLEKRFGISLEVIPWSSLASFSEYVPSGSFIRYFSGTNYPAIVETARVSTMLEDTIQRHNLDAITVECFPMVQKDGVTACLPLAKFNDEGIPAGCEGDLTAIAGMMLCRELTGIVPWIANINKVTGNVCLFSHCTIAPGLVSRFAVTTHYETGKGTAIEGDFKGGTVTVFRFDQTLGKAFIATAPVAGRPKQETACRTQIEVKFTPDEVRLLRENPLGNHHLIVPGDCKRLLQFACLLLGIDVLHTTS